MNQNNSFEEKREHVRFDRNIPVKISGGDFDLVTETRNLSRSGAYCRVNKYIEPMTKLRIYLLLPFKKNDKIVTKKISCSGVIVRTESDPGNDHFNVAIYFNDVKNRDADYMAEYVNSLLEDDASTNEG